MSQAERRFVKLGDAGGGHCPFRGLDAPFALEKNLRVLPDEVNLDLTTCFCVVGMDGC